MNLLKLKVFFLSTLLLCAFTTTAQESSFNTMVDALISGRVPVLSVEELQTKPNIILLDTRTKAEYDVSHIENAVWVGEKNWDLKSLKQNKEQTVVVYCSVGYRSEKLVKKLLHLNFKRPLTYMVVFLIGSIKGILLRIIEVLPIAFMGTIKALFVG